MDWIPLCFFQNDIEEGGDVPDSKGFDDVEESNLNVVMDETVDVDDCVNDDVVNESIETKDFVVKVASVF